MFDIFQNDALVTVALGTALLGIVSGALGTFAVLRKQSLLGDVISHCALPGIMLAYLLTGTKTSLGLMVGAAVSGWLGTLVVLGITRASRVKDDAALGLVLSVFYGMGMMLYASIQRLPDATQAGLKTYLFGQAATLLDRDVITMAVLGAIALTVLAWFWREFKLVTFDPEYAASLGVPVRRFEILLTGLLVLAIVVGLSTVGVVLMSALVVAPAAAARQWTDRLARMVVLAAAFGAVAGVTGSALSTHPSLRLPTGPAVVLVLSAVVVFSLLLAPNRGLAWQAVRHLRNRRRLEQDAVLSDLAALSAQHGEEAHGHAIAVLQAMSPRPESVRATLRSLDAAGWVRVVGRDQYALTPEGREQLALRQSPEEGPS